MPKNEAELNVKETEAIAKEACAYSRSHIINGSSWPKNNEHPEAEVGAAQRKGLSQAMTNLRALWEDPNATIFDSQLPENPYELNRIVEPCEKFALGNCAEMAFLAFHYILENNPSLNAEVYRIRGGDHAFLVVGRQANSDPNDPDTWGSNAFICDPWAENEDNRVYPASQYKEKLKNCCYMARDAKEGCYLVRTEIAPTIENLEVKDQYQYIIFENRLWYYDCILKELTEIQCPEENSFPPCLNTLSINEKRQATLEELSQIISFSGHRDKDYYIDIEDFDPVKHTLEPLPFLNTPYFSSLKTLHHLAQGFTSMGVVCASVVVTMMSSFLPQRVSLVRERVIPTIAQTGQVFGFLAEGLVYPLLRMKEASKHEPPTPSVPSIIRGAISAFFKPEMEKKGHDAPNLVSSVSLNLSNS